MLKKLEEIDKALLIQINSGMASELLDHFMIFISSPIPWFLGSSLWIAFLIWRRDKQLWLIFMVAALLIGFTDAGISYVVKPLAGRIRPCKDFNFIRIIDGCGGFKSFPSNHAANAMILAIFALKYARLYLSLPLVITALTMGFSRVYLGVHFPSDVVVGHSVGLLIGLIGIVICNYLVREKAASQSSPDISKSMAGL